MSAPAPLSRRSLVVIACTSMLMFGLAASAGMAAQAAETPSTMTPITTLTTVAPPWPGFSWPDIAWSQSPNQLPQNGGTITFTATDSQGGSFTKIEGALCKAWSPDGGTGSRLDEQWAVGDCIVQDASTFTNGVASIDYTINRGTNSGTNLRGEPLQISCLNEDQCSVVVRITNSLNTNAQYWWDLTWFLTPTTTTTPTTIPATTTTGNGSSSTRPPGSTTLPTGPSTTPTTYRTTTRPPLTTTTSAGPTSTTVRTTTTSRPAPTTTRPKPTTTRSDFAAFWHWLICFLFGC